MEFVSGKTVADRKSLTTGKCQEEDLKAAVSALRQLIELRVPAGTPQDLSVAEPSATTSLLNTGQLSNTRRSNISIVRSNLYALRSLQLPSIHTS